MKPWDGRPDPVIVLTGQINVQVTNSSYGTAAVTFPADTFTEPPNVQVSACYGAYTATMGSVPTATSLSLVVRRFNTTAETRTVPLQWVARSGSSSSNSPIPVPNPLPLPLPLPFRTADTATNGDTAGDTDTETATVEAICRTIWCHNRNTPLPYIPTITDDNGTPTPVDQVICGVCGRPITDRTTLEDSDGS